jgi:beta-galactosidase
LKDLDNTAQEIQKTSVTKKDARTVISLNGVWEFECGEADYFPQAWSRRAPVPGLVDLAEPVCEWENSDYFWYRTKFRLNGDRKYEAAFLRIGQAQYGTAVWFNGIRLGGSISCYTSQEYFLDGSFREAEENELVIRVGLKATLPPESAVGKDLEKKKFIPGIWGDVSLVLSDSPRISLVQIIPHIATNEVEAHITVENLLAVHKNIAVDVHVKEKSSRVVASEAVHSEQKLAPGGTVKVVVRCAIDNCRWWTPEFPFLYELHVSVSDRKGLTDTTATTFGVREFKVIGPYFYLNGQRIFLKGGNVAFHRFLSDPERGTLPWNKEWVKRALIDIPKEHNFNFFRNHLGQMYPLWYDLADEYGMLIQNEWQFWGTTGTKDQITKEFTEWLHDNWNHPSIVIWDALNESKDEIVEKEIIPEMKKIDPTRPWEPVDFLEDHPYIYSLGPALNNQGLGFTRSLQEIERSAFPSVVNEFIWWWLDKDGNPTELTKQVVERWLGKDYTKEDLFQHQEFLAQELVELFRRLRVKAIQPFVYLSNNDGPTSHWFQGPISELKPKPVLAALKNAFVPFGLSIELWDRHFFVNEKRTVRLFVFNDHQERKSGEVRLGIIDSAGKQVWQTRIEVSVAPTECWIRPVEITLPNSEGRYLLRAELHQQNDTREFACSEKALHVFVPPSVSMSNKKISIALLSENPELKNFLQGKNFNVDDFPSVDLHEHDVLLIGEGMVRDPLYQSHLDAITEFVRSGHSLIVLEPEFDSIARERVPLVHGIQLAMEFRLDSEKGGYDSYVFAEDSSHPIFRKIDKEHLKFFNGAFGGEIVSQHNIGIAADHTVLARCGLNLSVIAAAEIPFGNGKIIINRIQTRGRLLNGERTDDLFARRADPVAQQLLLNLLSYAVEK